MHKAWGGGGGRGGGERERRWGEIKIYWSKIISIAEKRQ